VAGIKFHNLVSFALHKGDKIYDGLHPEWNTMLDSGGFTNFVRGKDVVTLKQYCEFLKEEKGRFWQYMALDRIGDQKTSLEYLNKMNSTGLSPIPIYQRGEGSASDLQNMLRNNFMVAVGGISQQLNAKTEQEYLRNVMRVINKVKVSRVHLLGVGLKESYMYAPYSADSSTWTSHLRFAILRLYYKGKFVEFAKHPGARTGKNYVKPNIEKTRVLQQYGLTWDDLYVHKDWSKTTSKISIAGTRSWMRQCRALIRKDCRYSLACIPVNVQALHEAWKYERRSWGWTSPIHFCVKKLQKK
jgi:hypothetical protein